MNEIIIFTSNDEEEDGKKSVKIFHDILGGKIIELKNHGHFTFDDMKTYEFPELLNEIISKQKFPIFTTRPDTIYGVTFMVISAQHQRLMEFVTKEHKKDVEKFVKKIKSVSEKEQEFLDKEGVFTGSHAINPITKERVPIWVGNFVVADYGSGMVMAVPAHDQRDFEFAKKYGIEIKPVVLKKSKESYSFVMGIDEKTIKDVGVQIVEKTKDGFFKIKIPFDKLEDYKKFIRKNLQSGFWNEFSTEDGFYFIFKHKDGKIEEMKLNETTNRLIDKYGMTFNDEKPKVKHENVYSWLAKNDLYKELLIHTDNGILINSSQFNGLSSEKAKEEVTKFLEKQNSGRKKVQFKLRDWLISRQRYWGTPIPVVYCDKCGIVPVDEKDLPIKLPMDVKFGKGNPLATNEKFVNTKCPKCGAKARRETDTMDTFVDSSWYYMRYPDNKNDKEPFDKKIEKYWLPVDQYIGGIEHATMHLLYARFWTKALRDLDYVDYDEPFLKLFNQGMLLGEGGEKMSKSKGNVILPEVVSEKYGIDTARFFLMSLAAPDKAREWSDNGVEGSLKFVKKIIDYFENVKIEKNADAKTESKLNNAIKEVTEFIEEFKYNLAVISLRELFAVLPEKTSRDVLEKSLKLISPFCPHIAEELWEKIKGKGFISVAKWPKHDKSKIDEKFEKQEQMIEKLSEDINNIIKLVGEKKKCFVYVLPNEKGIYSESVDMLGKKIGMKIEIFSVNDKDKYDPENKSKKVKPGKPGIYLE